MQQLNIFGSDENSPSKKEIRKNVKSTPIKEKGERNQVASGIITNPIGTEMVVNDQIKIKIKNIKHADKTKEIDAMDNIALIEKIKAKLKKEFDLLSPVEKGGAVKKNSRKKENVTTSFSATVNIPADEILFQKQYYSMGQVAEMFGVNASMLRCWENEFDILQPKKNKKGDRFFRPVDIKNLELIYHLLRNRKFTIEGAKVYLKQHKQRAVDAFAIKQSLENLKAFLLKLKSSL